MKMPIIPSLFKTKASDAGWLSVGMAAHGIYLAQVLFNGAKPRVVRCEYRDGSISTEELERVKDEAGLGKAVCTTLLAPGEYQMLLVEAPVVPDSELKTAVRWKIKDSLSYPVDDATVDVLQIPVNKNRTDQRPQSLYAIASPNPTIQKRMDLFDQAGLELRVIDIPETAQRNIAALFEQKDRALAMLAFDEQGGLLTFTSDGELYLSRRIEITIGQLSDANESLREQYRDRVELELQRSLDYFDRQFNHLSLSRVILSAPDDAGLLKLLDAAVGVAVERLDLSQVMDISAVPGLADSEFAARALPALGAALRQEARV
ncbi:MAG: agglutinin biogenesis protein MshI [Proteobacteria bacterium]|nr:agglutinin biogenesis protein MshI [Pseudomonadota bacterium]